MTRSSTIGVRLPNELIEHLKKKARKMSYEKNKNISFSKLIREAVQKCYPISKKK